MKTEFEVKFYTDPVMIHKKLKSEHAKLLHQSCLMKRWIYVIENQKNSWLRVRDEEDKTILTYKTFDQDKAIDAVQELEVQVESFEKMCQILDVLNLKKLRYVENYREKWQLHDCYIMIDTWPGLDKFIEIEGPSEQSVLSMVDRLSLSMDNALYGPTALLYEKKYGLSRQMFDQIKELKFDTVENVIQKIKT